MMKRYANLFAAALASALLAAPPTAAEKGSGSDGTPDADIEKDIEEDIEKDIEERLEERIDDKVSDRVGDRIENRASRSGRSGPGDGGDRKRDDKTEDRAADRIGDSAAARVSDATVDQTKEKAKAKFDAAKDAADFGRDVARAEARRIRDAALAAPGANQEEIEAVYKASIKAADLQRDVARDAAEASYRAALNELDDGNSGHGSRDDEAVANASRVFEASVDRNGDEITRGEWLALATRDEVAALERRGHKVKSVEALSGLGVLIARVEAPRGFDMKKTAASVHADAPRAEVDYNHIFYNPSGADAGSVDGDEPRALMQFDDKAGGEGLKIGVIDTAIDGAHPSLKAARVVSRDFVPYEMAKPTDHGTAVVSILAGDDARYAGLAPKAEVRAASVFFTTENGRPSATTESLVKALDWLVALKTPTISMSLAGPPNAVLEAAIKRAAEQGVTVVAAAGNEGPAARPMFPAAYEDAVAVTAVTRDKAVYRLANHGDYVDFSAPGVLVRHARDGGGYAASSGTSIAAPFVAAALAELRRNGAHDAGDAYRLLIKNAEDLGAPGRDPVYGAGLVRPVAE